MREPCSSYSYDDKGNPVSAKEGGAKTDCEYESGTSILTKYTASTGVVTNFTYESGTHNLLTTTSAGVTSANTYNAMGLVTETVTHDSGWALAQQSSAVYDTFGRKTSSTDVNNITTTNTYYNYFPKSTQTGGGAVQNYDYNSANGRLNSTSIASVATQHNVYAQGMLTRLARQSGATTSTDWQSYQFGYDSFGNMLSVSVSDAAKTGSASNSRTLATYGYDDSVNNGLLQSMTYGNNATVEYEYDIFDRTTKETYNNDVVYNYAYDASGALAKQWSSTGEEYRYEYDSLGRLIRSSEYNSGAFIQRTEHIYDESDRLTRQAWYNGSGATSQTYEYSETNGLLTNLGIYYPGNIYNATPGASNTPSVGIAYSYNAINLLTGKTVSAGGSTVYSKSYSYNTFQAKPGRTGTANLVSELSYGGSLSNLTRQYTYDANGNIASEQVGSQTYSYEYDNLNQLTKVENGSGETLYSYTYDNTGNIVSKTDGSTTHSYTYNDAAWADLLTAYDGHNITYEGQTYTNGDVTGTPTSGNPTRYYNGKTWNMEWENGRELSRITRGSKIWDFTYDMAGVRSGKTVTTIDTSTGEITGTTEYKYTTLSGKLVRVEYNTTILDIVYDESGQPFSIRYKSSPTATGALYYYVLNAQGDVIGLLNSSGELVVEYKYDPWGKLLETIIGVDETDSKYAAYNNMGLRNPLRYRGYIYDRDTGLYYLQSRYYDPAIGRFINADTYTTTDADGLLSTNMFAYCENNPVMGTDPTGEWVHLAVGAIVGGIMGGISAAAFGGNVISGIATGALGGALAISGAGRAAQIVGSAALSAINNTVTQLTSKPIASFSINELITETASGALAGVLGGEGASITNAKSIMGYGKQAIKQIKGNIKHGKSVFKPIKNYLSRAHVKGNQSVFKAFAKSITLPTLYSNGRNIYKQFFVNR